MENSEKIFKEAVESAVQHIKASDFGKKYITKLQVVKPGCGHYGYQQIFYGVDENNKPTREEELIFSSNIQYILGIQDKESGYWNALAYPINSDEYLRYRYDVISVWDKENPDVITYKEVEDRGPRFIAHNKMNGEEFEWGLSDLYAFDENFRGIGIKKQRVVLSRILDNKTVSMNPNLEIRLADAGSKRTMKFTRQAQIDVFNGAVKHITKSEFGKKYITSVKALSGSNFEEEYITLFYECDKEIPTLEEKNQFCKEIDEELFKNFLVPGFESYLVTELTPKMEKNWEDRLVTIWQKEYPEEFHGERRFVKELKCRDLESGLTFYFSLSDLLPFSRPGEQGGITIKRGPIVLSYNSSFGYYGLNPNTEIRLIGEAW